MPDYSTEKLEDENKEMPGSSKTKPLTLHLKNSKFNEPETQSKGFSTSTSIQIALVLGLATRRRLAESGTRKQNNWPVTIELNARFGGGAKQLGFLEETRLVLFFDFSVFSIFLHS